MSELTESELITKINNIDAEIAAITDTLGSDGATGAQNVDYSIGNKRISGSQRLDQLIKAREVYQKLLGNIPKTIIRDHGMHDYGPAHHTGEDNLEFIGDE